MRRLLFGVLFSLAAATPVWAAGFMPTAQDLSTPAAPTADAKTQDIKDSRWVQPDLKKTVPEKAKPSAGKLSVTSSCTDANGRTLASTDPGYAACVQESAAAAQEAKARPKASDPKTAVGAGVLFKFGG